MKILRDHCANRAPLLAFPSHETRHTFDLGWEQFENGDLLSRSALEFYLFVSVDKNLPFQTDLEGVDITVAILNVRSNLVKTIDPQE